MPPEEPVVETSQPSYDLGNRVGINIHEPANQVMTNPDSRASFGVVEVRDPVIEAAPVVETKPVVEPTPEAPVEQPAAATHKWTVQSLLDSYTEGLSPDDVRVKNFGFHKDYAAKVVKANEEQALHILELEKKLATLPATPSNLAPSEERLAVETEIATLKQTHEAEVKEYREWKAKQDLNSNEAFRREYDGRRVDLLGEARDVAKEIGLDEKKVEDVFNATTELQLKKAVKALDLEDEDAEKLILAKAQESMVLGNKKEQLLSGKAGKSITQLADEWRAHQAEFGQHFTTQMTASLQGQLIKSAQTAPERLADKSIFFKTPQGQMVFDEITTRFNQGYDLDTDQVVDAMALARVQPIFERQALSIAKERDDYKSQVSALQAQIATLTKGTPGALSQNVGIPPGGAPRSNPQGFVDPFQVRQGISLHGAPGR